MIRYEVQRYSAETMDLPERFSNRQAAYQTALEESLLHSDRVTLVDLATGTLLWDRIDVNL